LFSKEKKLTYVNVNKESGGEGAEHKLTTWKATSIIICEEEPIVTENIKKF